MPWLDADFSTVISSEVHPHFCGIDLVCLTPSLSYRALAPGYRIRAQRTKVSENFQVFFYKKDDLKFSRCAILTAGSNRLSIESCIRKAVSRPSLLQFRARPDRTSWEPGEPEPRVDTNWPKGPGPSEHRFKVNVYVVKPGRIYRLMSRKYRIAVWRKDFESCFRITFWRHGSKKKLVYETGSLLSEVREFVVSAIKDPEFLLHKKNIDRRLVRRRKGKIKNRDKKKWKLTKMRHKNG
jgi:hypothetical protein